MAYSHDDGKGTEPLPHDSTTITNHFTDEKINEHLGIAFASPHRGLGSGSQRVDGSACRSPARAHGIYAMGPKEIYAE